MFWKVPHFRSLSGGVLFLRNNDGALLDAWDAMAWLLGDDIRVFV